MELQNACFTVLNLRNLDYIQNRQNLISALYSTKCELPLHTHYYRWSTACSKLNLFSTISIYVKGLQLIFCHYTAVIFINTSQIDQKMAGIHGRVMFQSVLQCTQQNNVTFMYQHHLLCQPVSPEVMKFRSYIIQWHVQNATIPCHSQELLPFLSVMYFFLPPFSTNYSSNLSHLILPSISWSTSQSCCSQIHI